MDEEEYLNKAIELAARCKVFAEKTCRQWKEETSGYEAGWKSLSEIREIYLTLQMLGHKADLLLERGMLLRSLEETAQKAAKRPNALA